MRRSSPPPVSRSISELYVSNPSVQQSNESNASPLLRDRRFDYVIVDEAAQVTLPTCIGPLRLADRFILVGDQFQLPPLVSDRLLYNVSVLTSMAQPRCGVGRLAMGDLRCRSFTSLRMRIPMR